MNTGVYGLLNNYHDKVAIAAARWQAASGEKAGSLIDTCMYNVWFSLNLLQLTFDMMINDLLMLNFIQLILF